MVIKAPQATPFSAALIAQILLDAGLPPGHVNVVQGPGSEVGRWLIENQQIRFYTFTGSTSVGKQLHRDAGLRPIALELGSIAATLVCEDGDLDRAAPRIANSAFRRAGQACTSTQRLFVHRSVLEPFLEKFVARHGQPEGRRSARSANDDRADDQRGRSGAGGAVGAGGGGTRGAHRQRRPAPRCGLLTPTILVDSTRDMKILCEEIFAPVVSVIPFDSLDDAIAEINSTEFGLAAGIFTRDINTAMAAARRIHVGVVHINESSSSRVDLIPFSGVKDSGMGREGPEVRDAGNDRGAADYLQPVGGDRG